MKKHVSFLLSLLLIVSLSCSNFSQAIYKPPKSIEKDIQPLNIYYKFEAESLKDYSYKKETVLIDGVLVKYYHGKNYTIVDDPKNGLYKIDFKSNGDIYVNNKRIKTYVKDLSDKESLKYSHSNRSWKHYKTKEKYYDVIGLAPSVIGGIIGGYVGAKIGGNIGTIFSIAGGAVVGTISGGEFPEYYISLRIEKYYKTPVTTNRPITRKDTYVYHGPSNDKFQNYWFEC